MSGLHAVELAGRMRDKIFHNVPFAADELDEKSAHIFESIEHPMMCEQICATLHITCLFELDMWSKGKSRAQLPRDQWPPAIL